MRIKHVCDHLSQKPLMTSAGLRELLQAKQQILDAVAGTLPERLVQDTVLVVRRLARREATTAEVLSDRVCALVRESLKSLRQRTWKPDTALRLRDRGEGGH